VRNLLLALLAGLLYAASFPSYNLWPLAWVWALPLLYVLEDASPHRRFAYGMVSGLAAWTGILYWIAYVMETYGGMGLFTAAVLLFVLLLFLSLFFGAFAWIAGRLLKSRWPYLTVPGAWVFLELIRSNVPFSGFPWALLGHSQLPFLPLVQIAEVGGVYLISGLVLMAGVALYELVWKRRYAPLLATAVLVAACSGWGIWRIGNLPAGGEPLRAAVAQANVPQELKWDPAMVGSTMATYERLTAAAAEQGARLVVWPETSCPFYMFGEWKHTPRILELSRSHEARLLVGSPVYDSGRYYNRMWLLDGGRIEGFYDKVHLVPFGEYLPLAGLIEPWFGSLTGGVSDFSSAEAARPIGDMGVLICFESVFAGLTRDLCNQGAAYLVNASNDAWFKTWSTPEQHLAMACFRAVESRRWLLRSVNHGISAIVSPSGEIVEEIGLLKEGVIVADIIPITSLTLYTRFGPILAVFWAGVSLIAALTRRTSGVNC
jgi:apolipoprotein N-acyltransferase